MTPWLVLDYGDVISLPYDDAVHAEVARLIGFDAPRLATRYWTDRLDLDRGIASTTYWSGVAERLVGAEEAAVLDRVDLSGWARVNPAMLTLMDEQHAAGVRLALLSNAPHVQAAAFDALDWTHRFERVFVSCRMGLVKPDPAIFEHVLAALDAEPGDVTFVDDRRVNTAAAAALGIRAITFTGVDDLRAALSSGAG